MRYEGERSAAWKKAQRQARLKKKSGRIFTVYIVFTGILIVLNLFFAMKLQADAGRMKEQIIKINSRLALVQEKLGMTGDGADVRQGVEGEKGSDTNGLKDSQGSLGQTGIFPEGGVIGADSYAAKCGLDEVDKPRERSSAEVLQRLKELGKESELIAKIYENRLMYPDKMLEALANNPEMADFVSGYTGNMSKASGGFTKEELSMEFPLLLQWDPRWGYVDYGNKSCIGLTGCGPTCLSMALLYLTGDESITPDKVAAHSMNNGYYVAGAGTAWALLTDYPNRFGVGVSEPEHSEQGMKYALDQGKVIICSMGPGTFTAAGHFVVVYGYDDEGLMINDPNCVARSLKRWSYKEIAGQIKHIWILGGESDMDGKIKYVER